MNNQAAQTMPELPDSQYRGGNDVFGKEFPLYTAAQMHQYARDYAASQTAGVAEPTLEMLNAGWRELERQGVDPESVEMRAVYDAMYAAAPTTQQTAGVTALGRYFADGPQGHFFADDLKLARDLVNLYDKDDDWTITDLRNPTGAAPAASGGDGEMCPNCVTPWKCNGPHESTGGASVSERARELLADAIDCNGDHCGGGSHVRAGGSGDISTETALRALEQALTQQRGAASYDAGMAMHWIERYAAGIDEECQLDRIAEAFTTPQPSADAVREDSNG